MPDLLDANILSELRNPQLQSLTTSPIGLTEQRRINTISIAEIRFGISIAKDLVKREDIRLWIIEILLPLFEGQILDVTKAVLLRWRILLEAGRKAGRTYAQPDLLLAATALEYDLILVTGNTRDFTNIPA